MTNWWKSATTEQRIAQVKGAIEIGLTQRETALLLGCGRRGLQSFSSYHKLSFGGSAAAHKKRGLAWKESNAQANRKSRAEKYGAGYNDAAHEIFPREQDVFLEPRR